VSNNCCGLGGAPKVKKSCCTNDAKNFWLTGSGEFDPNNPFVGWTPPASPTQGSTVGVSFGDTLAFFTWTGQTWVLDYYFAIPPPVQGAPESFIENVELNNGLLSFSGVGGAFNGVIDISGCCPEYQIKKWCGVVTDNLNGTFSVNVFNDNSPDYFGNLFFNGGVGSYTIDVTSNMPEGTIVTYIGPSVKGDLAEINDSESFSFSLSGLDTLSNDALCFEFHIPIIND
jgi:hypothetical protein